MGIVEDASWLWWWSPPPNFLSRSFSSGRVLRDKIMINVLEGICGLEVRHTCKQGYDRYSPGSHQVQWEGKYSQGMEGFPSAPHSLNMLICSHLYSPPPDGVALPEP